LYCSPKITLHETSSAVQHVQDVWKYYFNLTSSYSEGDETDQMVNFNAQSKANPGLKPIHPDTQYFGFNHTTILSLYIALQHA